MTVHRAAAYLIRFDEPPSPPPPPVAVVANDDAPAIEVLYSPPPPAAVEEEPLPPRRSEEEIYAEAEAKFAATLDDERQAFERRLKEERERWVAEQSEKLRRLLTRAFDDAMTGLRSDLTRILCPFVSREIADQVLDDLVAAARKGLSGENAAAVTISGPRDLLEKLEAALNADNITMASQESNEVDAQVAFASTIVESRLSEWIGRLSNEKGGGK